MEESELPSDYAPRFRANLENWKRKLLDLSRRNRALNFKPTRVSTVAIVDEQPAEVFRRLYLNEAAMRFKAVEASDSKGSELNAPLAAIDEAADFESESEEALEFVPYDPSTLDDRHRDDWLQTKLAPEALDHSLRRIDEQARSAVEEQGVNTLFLAVGMLRYRESRDSDEWMRAPLVLVPVQLTRRTARAGFVITVSDDDALVNPGLAEYLRASFGLQLPVLPDAEAIPDDFDLQSFFTAVSSAVASQSGWTVLAEIWLGLFSFQKLVMFKDLEVSGDAIAKHRLVRQLLSKTGTASLGLPTSIRKLSLDKEFTPEATFQVVDADSTQMRAAAAVANGHDIVIEGPPGTGKSQTITNLVAQTLAAGKSVLFVAEKMAALEVVHRRLVEAGLAEACLELHSSKANKRTVMQELSRALDASMQPIAGGTSATDRLPQVRADLATYVNAVHEPFGALQRSPFRVAGELGLVLDAPPVSLALDVQSVSSQQIEEAERALRQLQTQVERIGDPSQHPWRDSGRTLYSMDDLANVSSYAEAVDLQVAKLRDDANRVCQEFGLPAVSTLNDIDRLLELAELLGDSPGVDASILQSDSWNEAPRAATLMIEKVRQAVGQGERLRTKLQSDAFLTEHAADAAYVEQKSAGVLSFLAFLDGRYRAIKRRWVGYRLSGYEPSMAEQAADMRLVDQFRTACSELDRDTTQGTQLFGAAWHGSRSDAKRLDAYVQYVVRFRKAAVKHRLATEAARKAQETKPDVSAIKALVAAVGEARRAIGTLEKSLEWPDAYLVHLTLTGIMDRCMALVQANNKAPEWAAFELSRQDATRTVGAEIIPKAMAHSVPWDRLANSFLRAFYMKWMTAAVQSRAVLHRFDSLTHEAMVSEFRKLDEMVLRENRATLIGRLRDRVQDQLQQPAAAACLPKLRREITKQRRHSPLRRTLRECEAAIRAVKPCFMMSPLTVAQYLGGDQPTFDVVIFDEASQMPTEDAIGAVVRGRQLVVVGDPKQLPPTNFFSVSSGTSDAPLSEDGSPLYEDSESVLEEFMGAAVPMTRLKWHYRSAHESLISFSNVNFYDADLHTFPSVVTDTDAAGLQFCYVDGGVYEGKGVNLAEARRVADEVVAFAKLQMEHMQAGEPVLSLGVGTLNLRQQLAILDELEVRRRDDPSIEPFFDRAAHEPFFVKNLENIQGDERDAIFLSITYGKSVDGRLRYNFGPLNRENGWRRLNVLVTRARKQMKVFASIRDTDINPAATTSDGPRLLRDFLSYAEHKRLGNATMSAADDTESPFERDVCLELQRHGIKVQPQVGVCGYRVDIGVLDSDLPGRFVCGIECDGVGYHSMETVRDRDRLRQQVLEARGWTIYRVWSTDWFKDRAGQVDRVLRLIEQARSAVRSEERIEREERFARAAVAPIASAPPLIEPESESYTRPKANAYQQFEWSGKPLSNDLLTTSLEILADLVRRVVEMEGPVHEQDVIARLCEIWDTKAGSRIQTALRESIALAQRSQFIRVDGRFCWTVDGRCEVRSRTGTGITGDRIAPEEIAKAIQMVVSSTSFERAALVTEVRSLFGYNRTGPVLESVIGKAIDSLVADGVVGEGSRGLMLRAAQV